MKKKIIPSFLILITIFVSVGCGNTVEKEEAERMIAAKKTMLKDEAINYGKSSETMYVHEALTYENMPLQRCYTIRDLENNGYVYKNDKYKGKVIITNNGNDTSKEIYLTDGEYMVKDFNYDKFDNDNVVLLYKDSWKTDYETCN